MLGEPADWAGPFLHPPEVRKSRQDLQLSLGLTTDGSCALTKVLLEFSCDFSHKVQV